MPPTTATAKQQRSGPAVAAALLCGAANLVFGVWSLLRPGSFAAFIAFPPYNEHLLHDLGAFQLGLGAGLLLALVWADAISVTLAGFAVAGAVHTANHTLDHHLGGHPGDPWGLGALTLLALLGLVGHQRRSRTPRAPDQGRGPEAGE
jgi:MYXO-CTERM domain-containing protein